MGIRRDVSGVDPMGFEVHRSSAAAVSSVQCQGDGFGVFFWGLHWFFSHAFLGEELRWWMFVCVRVRVHTSFVVEFSCMICMTPHVVEGGRRTMCSQTLGSCSLYSNGH